MGFDSNLRYLILMVGDFYQIIVMYALTFIVSKELQDFRTKIQTIFISRQYDTSDDAKLQSLTLMIVAQHPDDFLSKEVIGEFEAYANRHAKIKEQQILNVYHIPNLHKAYDLLSELRVTQVCRELYKELELKSISRVLTPSRIFSDTAYATYEQRQMQLVENETVSGAEYTGITFACFRSSEAIAAFRYFIRK